MTHSLGNLYLGYVSEYCVLSCSFDNEGITCAGIESCADERLSDRGCLPLTKRVRAVNVLEVESVVIVQHEYC